MGAEVEQHDPIEGVRGSEEWVAAAMALGGTSTDEQIFETLTSAAVVIVDELIEVAAQHEHTLADHPLAHELASLRALGELCAGLAQMVRGRPEPDPTPLATALLMLNAMARQRMFEAETLILADLGDGALILARTLYETSTKAIILRRFHGTEGHKFLADHYLMSSMVETRGNARIHEETWGQHGHAYDPNTLARVEAIAKEQIDVAAEQGNPLLAKSNGWAAPINGGKVPTLRQMAELAEVDDHQLAYKHASHLVHANAYAAIQYGDPVCGPDVYGQNGSLGYSAMAGMYTALGVGRTCEALIGEHRTPVEVRALLVLQQLSARAHKLFHDAAGRLVNSAG